MEDPFNCEKLSEAAQVLLRANSLTVKKLAIHLYMDRTTLYRKVKKCTGLSPAQWIAHFKLEIACIRLTTTQDLVSAIAVDCGYENVTSFNKAFQIKYGMTPSGYRCKFRNI